MSEENLIYKIYPKIQWNKVSALYAEFFERFNHDNIQTNRMAFDRTYRIYHYSFKMYYMTESIFDMWNILFKVFNFKTINSFNQNKTLLEKEIKEKNYKYYDKNNKELSQKDVLKIKEEIKRKIYRNQCNLLFKNLNLLGADKSLIEQMHNLKYCFYSRNEPLSDKWANDGLIMKGLLEITREIVLSTLNYLYLELNKKGLIFNESISVISSPTALVFDVFSGLSLRSRRNEQDKKFINMLKKIKKEINDSPDKEFDLVYTYIKDNLSSNKVKLTKDIYKDYSFSNFLGTQILLQFNLDHDDKKITDFKKDFLTELYTFNIQELKND